MIKQRSLFAQQIKYGSDNYAMPWQLQKMIQQLEKRAPTFWTEEQYEDLFNHG